VDAVKLKERKEVRDEMARIILLNVPDNAAAEDFAREMLEAEKAGIPLPSDMPALPEGTTIEALIARPTLACKCGSQGNKMKAAMGWSRTPKFGWWVHAGCNRPAPMVVRDWVKNMLNGTRNLLADIAPDEKWPQPRTDTRDAIDEMRARRRSA
jgi:hypothetical protein